MNNILFAFGHLGVANVVVVVGAAVAVAVAVVISTLPLPLLSSPMISTFASWLWCVCTYGCVAHIDGLFIR